MKHYKECFIVYNFNNNFVYLFIQIVCTNLVIIVQCLIILLLNLSQQICLQIVFSLVIPYLLIYKHFYHFKWKCSPMNHGKRIFPIKNQLYFDWLEYSFRSNIYEIANKFGTKWNTLHENKYEKHARVFTFVSIKLHKMKKLIANMNEIFNWFFPLIFTPEIWNEKGKN